jgi:hypothetical protein
MISRSRILHTTMRMKKTSGQEMTPPGMMRQNQMTRPMSKMNEEVSKVVSGTNPGTSNILQAQKFQNLDDNDSDDELGEESLLETPLDKIEPYQLFRDALLSKSAIL